MLIPLVPVPYVPISTQVFAIAHTAPVALQQDLAPNIPFYSQFTDITSPAWKKVGCGVTSLAMIIDYYAPAVPVDTLLNRGIATGAYLDNAGWTYNGLIGIAQEYGLDGTSYDFANLTSANAFSRFKRDLANGPVIASVHYSFDPKSTIPHLVVITGIEGEVMYYNDPAAKSGGRQISVSKFIAAWKKRYIVIRPDSQARSAPLAKK